MNLLYRILFYFSFFGAAKAAKYELFSHELRMEERPRYSGRWPARRAHERATIFILWSRCAVTN